MRLARIVFYGKVQGVGFRPCVCKIARTLKQCGEVRNLGNAAEVILQLPDSCTNPQEALRSFINQINANLPKEAKITQTQVDFLAKDPNLPVFTDFHIAPSQNAQKSLQSILPQDTKICQRCLEDMEQKSRFLDYAFTTCTDCGPRYSLIKKLPYDREHTSMADFEMCEDCKRDYFHEGDIRFHAQTLSCKQCAIQLEFLTKDRAFSDHQALEQCYKALLQNQIVAIKGVGGFALCALPTPSNIQRLRILKKRPAKPLALMVKDVQTARNYATINPQEKQVLESKIAPIVLLRKLKNSSFNHSLEALAPGLDRVGIILPYSGLHFLLMRHFDSLIFTSANLSSEPIITDSQIMQQAMGALCDGILDYNRQIVNGIDDSLVQVMGFKNHQWVQILRLARGYAPLHAEIQALSHDPSIRAAMGAQERVSLAYRHRENIVITPYIGDLDHPLAWETYERTHQLFSDLYEMQPDVMVSDLHPYYHSSLFSAKKAPPNGLKKLQHHKAHFASIFADSMLQDPSLNPKDKALGIIWDGTGFGEDGGVWGGEFFYGAPLDSLQEVCRIGHFRGFKIYGGELSARQSYKAAYSLLHHLSACHEEGILAMSRILEQQFPSLQLLSQAMQKEIGYFESHSVGRLFDILACFCGLCHEQTYEAQGARMMQRYFDANFDTPFSYKIESGVVELEKMWCEILQLCTQKPLNEELISQIVSRFIWTLAHIALDFVKDFALDSLVMFSGGVFANENLCFCILKLLDEHFSLASVECQKIKKSAKPLQKSQKPLRAFFHHFVPCGDGGIALGQATAAL